MRLAVLVLGLLVAPGLGWAQQSKSSSPPPATSTLAPVPPLPPIGLPLPEISGALTPIGLPPTSAPPSKATPPARQRRPGRRPPRGSSVIVVPMYYPVPVAPAHAAPPPAPPTYDVPPEPDPKILKEELKQELKEELSAERKPEAPPKPSTFYFIPGCYMGNVPPSQVTLPPNCDRSKVITRKP